MKVLSRKVKKTVSFALPGNCGQFGNRSIDNSAGFSYVSLFAAAGSTDRPGSGHPQDQKPCVEYQPGEQVSLKERLAMYQAAVTKKETGSSSSAAVR